MFLYFVYRVFRVCRIQEVEMMKSKLDKWYYARYRVSSCSSIPRCLTIIREDTILVNEHPVLK